MDLAPRLAEEPERRLVRAAPRLTFCRVRIYSISPHSSGAKGNHASAKIARFAEELNIRNGRIASEFKGLNVIKAKLSS